MSSSADPDTNVSYRRVWRESDFDDMLWKEVWIHGIGMIYEPPVRELLFDLDYILEWTKSVPGKGFGFWVSPSTLCFQNAGNLSVNLEGVLGGLPLQIYDLVREENSSPDGSKWSHWDLEDIHHGHISFNTTGFEMYVRRRPILRVGNPWLNEVERGGISFDRTIE